MAPSRNQPSLNPTIEDLDEEIGHRTSPGDGAANHQQLSWPEIFARHESVLSSHLDMLCSVKGSVTSNSDIYRMVATMTEKTNKLMTQFKVMKSQLQKSNNNTVGSALDKPTFFSGTPLSTSASSHHRGDGSTFRQSRSRERKKRPGRDEMDAAHDDDPFAGMLHSQKRKRVDATLPGDDEGMSNGRPVSMETEDISEEVQRRLRIKEEQRKKRNTKPEKRKRDSLASNGSTSSPGTASKPRKKPKVSARDEGTNLDTAGTSGNRTRRFDRISDPDPTLLPGAKRQKQIAGLDAI